MGYSQPTPIQEKAIPLGLDGKDVIGLAQTGSGKTAAFALPILQHLLTEQRAFFAVAIAPTRELAIQISETFEALGAQIGLKVAVLVGGIDLMTQSLMIAKKPHILIATPGRLVDHLENTKGFNLKNLRFLVLDEADRLLDMDFGAELDKILAVIPRERTTFMFSATMTTKVQKLQRASLRDPVRVEVSTKFSTVASLHQTYLFIPAKYKDCYLTYVVNELTSNSMIIFVSTCNTAQKLAFMLRNLGFQAVPIHGQMPQPDRLGALNKFKAGSKKILIATDVASRGLDIPTVDAVLNYDVPSNPKDYIHRVGRTARAGRSGKAVTFVTQYDVELYQKIEEALGKKLAEFPISSKDAVMVFHERVMESQRFATMQIKELERGSEQKRPSGPRKKEFFKKKKSQ